MVSQKKPSQRAQPRRGQGAAKAKVVHENADEASEQTLLDGVWPADPDDPRLTVAGIKLGGDGKIDVDQYKDLMAYFAAEPAPDQHPDPSNPGVRQGEKIPKGMRNWDDVRAGAKEKNGAGWIARRTSQHEPSKEKWFNIRICGSWRMAFILARLQRLHWDERAAWIKAEISSQTGHESKQEPSRPSIQMPAASEQSPAPEAEQEKAASSKEEASSSKHEALETPKAKRARSATEKNTTQKKRQRQGEPKEAPAPQKELQQPALKTKLIDPNALSTSVRLQQILARQQLQKQSQ